MSDEDLPDSLIPYDEIVQDALRAVVARVLGGIQSNLDLPGTHHFYITFKSHAPGVSIPKQLAQRFPDEMTIVLQNKFWDLAVEENGFTVSLTFSQVPTKLFIPFDAITTFHDPAVDFALQFQAKADDAEDVMDPADAENDVPLAEPVEPGSNVVTVDFGKKK
ncbi:MAG: hypothetical protein IPN84_09235 [Sphingomonadales bacterium]|jgi:hypothetical protein|nr:hypothetical protein [Sphingomonadales bacterium]